MKYHRSADSRVLIQTGDSPQDFRVRAALKYTGWGRQASAELLTHVGTYNWHAATNAPTQDLPQIYLDFDGPVYTSADGAWEWEGVPDSS